MFVKRERFLKQIRPYYDVDLIKVLTGVRRCGKSILLNQIEDEYIEQGFPKDHIIKINFEDFEFDEIRTNQRLNKYVKEKIIDDKKYLIFLDEIQHVKDFEKILSSFRATLNCNIFVTGSNSKLLSGKLATLLVGRCVEFKIMPFSFMEACEFVQQTNPDLNPYEFIDDYIKWGGLPLRYSFPEERQIQNYIEQTYNGIVEKDVVNKNKRFNKQRFMKFSGYIMANVGKDFSASNIVKFFNNKNDEDINKNIIYSYLSRMEEACLINRVKRFNISGKESMAYTEKQYSTDTAFSLINTNFINYDVTYFLENVIYNELFSRGYEKVFVGKTYKSEVDFVVIDGNKKCFIQVAYQLYEDPKAIEEKHRKGLKSTIEREFGAFDPISDNSPKYVFSLDTHDYSMNGIEHINIVDFLLEKKEIHLS